MNVVAVSTHKRPFHTRLCLESIARAQNWYPWADEIIVTVTPHGDPEVVAAVKAARCDDWEIVLQPREMNVHDAAKWMLDESFASGADCVLYVEDDVVLSPDAFVALEFMHHRRYAVNTNPLSPNATLLGMCLYHETIPANYPPDAPPNPALVHLGNGLNTCGGTAFLRDPYLKYIAPNWNCKKVEPRGFDYSAHYTMYKNNLWMLWLDYSRSTNIGFTLGSCSPEFWRKYHGRSMHVDTARAFKSWHRFTLDQEQIRGTLTPVMETWMKPELIAEGLE